MPNKFYSIPNTSEQFIIDSTVKLEDSTFAECYDITKFIKMKKEKPENKDKSKHYVSNEKGEWELKLIVPKSLSRAQALTIMDLTPYDEENTVLKVIEDYMNKIDESIPMYKYIKNVWYNTIIFYRYDEAITTIASIFKIGDELLDEMFIKGSKFNTERE